MKTLHSVFAILLLSVLSTNLYADLVVGYDAINAASDSTVLTPINGVGVTGSNLGQGGGLKAEGGDPNYTWSKWTPAGNDPALQPNDSFVFSFVSTAPFHLDELVFRGVRSATGPMSFRLEVDSGLGFSVVGSDVAIGTTTANYTIDLSSLTSITSASFRLMGFESSNSGSGATFSLLDSGNFLSTSADFVVTGAAVPEPSAFLFGGLICSILGLTYGGAKLRRRLVAKA